MVKAPTSASVSVVIPQYGKTHFTARAIAAVRRSGYQGPIEIVVSDDASPDGPGEAEERDDITLVVAEQNAGFGHAVNAGAAVATGDYLLILNNDAVVAPDCIERLVETMTNHPDQPGLVGPQFRSFDGSLLELGSYLGPDGSGWQLFRGERIPASFMTEPFHAHYTSAACVLVDRADFVERGGFDSAYAPAYYEDTDLCMALRSEGKPVIIDPAAIAYHYEGGTAGTDLDTGIKTFQVRNRVKFVQRWRDDLAVLPPIGRSAAITAALQGRMKHAPVLWIIPQLPRPDREAGHRRAIRMMEALQGAGHPVALWAEHPLDDRRYGPVLERRGIRWFGTERRRAAAMSEPSGWSLQETLRAAEWSAAVISFPELAERMMLIIREIRPGLPTVVDVVDLHFLREERAEEAGIAIGRTPDRSWELGIYGASDGVIASSPLEQEILREELPELPDFDYSVAAEEPMPPPSGTLGSLAVFLGNFNHHPNLDAVDWWAQEVAPLVAELRGAPISLAVVGSESSRYRDRWPDEYVEVIGWVEDLEPLFMQTRVFFSPLRYGAGTKGKHTLAARYGIPILTTDIGAEGMPAALNPALHVANDPAGLAEILIRFMDDLNFAESARAAVGEGAEAAWREQQAVDAEFAAWLDRRIAEKERKGT